MIDWTDWTEMTNTLSGKDTMILPDGSTGVVWSTPTRISGDMWRSSRCTISNVRTTAVGKKDAGLPTDRGLSIGYKPGSWRGDGLSHFYNDGTNYTAGVANNPSMTSSNLPQGQTVLSESSSSPKSAGYKATVSCVPHPNSDIRTPSSTVNAASKTLNLAAGEWMQCTMVTGQVIWSKVDDAGNPLAGTVFTLASPALNGGQKEVTDCATDNAGTACPKSSIDQDPRAGYFKVVGLTWGEYSITETQAPAGYHLSSTTLTKTLDGSAPAASRDDNTPALNLGQVTTTRVKGSATWTKTDERGNPIKGAQWSLIPLDSNGRPHPDQARTITDCVGTCAQGGLDTDANPGAFKLAELGYGSYRLIETKPPTGYILDAIPAPSPSPHPPILLSISILILFGHGLLRTAAPSSSAHHPDTARRRRPHPSSASCTPCRRPHRDALPAHQPPRLARTDRGGPGAAGPGDQ